jgi:hypothetical protein
VGIAVFLLGINEVGVDACLVLEVGHILIGSVSVGPEALGR